jgi:hypothetical protein
LLAHNAFGQMDGVTQLNSALVEENATATKTLELRSTAMNEQIGFFLLDQKAVAAPPIGRSPSRNQPPRPVSRSRWRRPVSAAQSAAGEPRCHLLKCRLQDMHVQPIITIMHF